VLNSRGVTLSRPADSAQDGSSGGDARLAIKQQTEAYLGGKIAAILDQSFGAGRSTVSVDVTLDHDSLKITREDVVPASTANGDADGAIVRRKNSSRRAGTPVIPAQDKLAAGAARPADDEQTTDEIEYQHGRKIEQLVSTPGSIKRLSVGVVIPEHIGADRIDMLSKVIAMAAGLNSARGDALAIYPAYPAHSATGGAASAAAPDQQTLSRAARTGTPGTGPSQNPHLSSQAWLAISLAALAALSLSLLAWMLVHRRSAARRLVPAERERALQELQAWLDEPSATAIQVRGAQ
jgi:flagellar M-ring protein FliF